MAFNIKSEESQRLAKEIAAMTGVSMAKAVEGALNEKHMRLRRESAAARLRELSIDAASRIPEELRGLDYDAELYDEDGLPR